MRRSSLGPSLSLICVFALAPSLSPGRALANDSQAELELSARKACLSGQVQQGVEILSDLYIRTRDPNYLYNQGRCFQQNYRLEEALGRFEEYLQVSAHSGRPVSAADRAEAEKHIARCKALLAERKNEKPSALGIQPPPLAEPARPTEFPVASPTPAPSETDTLATSPSPAAGHSRPGSRLRTAGIVFGVVGLAAGTTGLVFNLRANKATRDIESKVGGYTPSALSNRRHDLTLAWIGYGVGAACLATGTVLTIIGLQQGSNSSAPVGIVPVAGADQTGLLLTGAF